ncbi:MAG: DUF3617 family protein [Alphaproteobacteria bacterium]|nr:DUF3617 family protein [Alphaproteobacteria bacterium]
MRLPAGLALILLSSPSLAAEMPPRKPGLWELKMTMESVAMSTTQQCIDAATDKQMSSMGTIVRADRCSKLDLQASGDSLTIDAVCDFGNGVTATSHAVVTGDFNSAYVMKSVSKRTGGPPHLRAETNTTIEAKWLGPCKADQRPGDMIINDSTKININDVPKIGASGTVDNASGMKR